jgi:hypothetical protein
MSFTREKFGEITKICYKLHYGLSSRDYSEYVQAEMFRKGDEMTGERR